MGDNLPPVPGSGEAWFGEGYDPAHWKRCVQCKLRRPIRDFAVKRDRLCYGCKGLFVSPSGKVTPLPPAKPTPKPRKNAASLPLDNYAAHKRYMREVSRARYEARRMAAGLPAHQPPQFRSPFGKCRACKQTMPRHHFPERSRICKPCLDAETREINNHYRGNNE
jgi:hypothetical protein